MSIEIAAVVNLHQEGRGATPSLISAWRAIEAARANGVAVEMLLVLDRPDAETNALAERWTHRGARVVRCDEGDLGAARNAAVRSTNATYFAFLDADDLWSENWLVRAVQQARNNAGRAPMVFHPEVNIIFGDHHSLLFHRASTDSSFRRARLRLHNLWTALCLVHRDVLERFPYPRNELAKGFGFEDWSWNLAVYDAGGEHLVVPDTCHFIRRTDTGSLLRASQSALRTPFLIPSGTRPIVTHDVPREVTPTNDDLPPTHRRLPHGLSAPVLEQVGFANSIEPEIATTITRDGHPRIISQNRNDHVTVEQQALEAADQIRSTVGSIDEVVQRCQAIHELSRGSRDRVIAELCLGEISAGRPLPSVTSGPIAAALATYPQLRSLGSAEST